MRNLGLAFLEALITLAITQVPILLTLVLYVLEDKEATLHSAIDALGNTFTPGDALIYSTGILASSTAYALVKIGSFRSKPALMIALIILPFVIIMSAMPLYIQDGNGRINNTSFAYEYVKWLLLGSAVLWIHALYQARAFFEVHVSDNAASNRIVKEIEG